MPKKCEQSCQNVFSCRRKFIAVENLNVEHLGDSQDSHWKVQSELFLNALNLEILKDSLWQVQSGKIVSILLKFLHFWHPG